MKAELLDSSNVTSRQEELIATLKEETVIISAIESELKDIKGKYHELLVVNEDYSSTIADLRKVSRCILLDYILGDYLLGPQAYTFIRFNYKACIMPIKSLINYQRLCRAHVNALTIVYVQNCY